MPDNEIKKAAAAASTTGSGEQTSAQAAPESQNVPIGAPAQPLNEANVPANAPKKSMSQEEAMEKAAEKLKGVFDDNVEVTVENQGQIFVQTKDGEERVGIMCLENDFDEDGDPYFLVDGRRCDPIGDPIGVIAQSEVLKTLHALHGRDKDALKNHKAPEAAPEKDEEPQEEELSPLLKAAMEKQKAAGPKKPDYEKKGKLTPEIHSSLVWLRSAFTDEVQVRWDGASTINVNSKAGNATLLIADGNLLLEGNILKQDDFSGIKNSAALKPIYEKFGKPDKSAKVEDTQKELAKDAQKADSAEEKPAKAETPAAAKETAKGADETAKKKVEGELAKETGGSEGAESKEEQKKEQSRGQLLRDKYVTKHLKESLEGKKEEPGEKTGLDKVDEFAASATKESLLDTVGMGKSQEGTAAASQEGAAGASEGAKTQGEAAKTETAPQSETPAASEGNKELTEEEKKAKEEEEKKKKFEEDKAAVADSSADSVLNALGIYASARKLHKDKKSASFQKRRQARMGLSQSVFDFAGSGVGLANTIAGVAGAGDTTKGILGTVQAGLGTVGAALGMANSIADNRSNIGISKKAEAYMKDDSVDVDAASEEVNKLKGKGTAEELEAAKKKRHTAKAKKLAMKYAKRNADRKASAAKTDSILKGMNLGASIGNIFGAIGKGFGLDWAGNVAGIISQVTGGISKKVSENAAQSAADTKSAQTTEDINEYLTEKAKKIMAEGKEDNVTEQEAKKIALARLGVDVDLEGEGEPTADALKQGFNKLMYRRANNIMQSADKEELLAALRLDKSATIDDVAEALGAER